MVANLGGEDERKKENQKGAHKSLQESWHCCIFKLGSGYMVLLWFFIIYSYMLKYSFMQLFWFLTNIFFYFRRNHFLKSSTQNQEQMQ